MILINAATLMHKSTLSTNKLGNIHFEKKYQKQKILEIFRLKRCLFEKFPTNRAKTRKCVFGQIFNSFENFVTLENYLWSFTSSVDASDVSVTADIICQHKIFQKLF